LANEKSKILIIEDDIDIADMLVAYFQIQGYEILTSNWGVDGIKSVVSNKPDLVILDIRLPDIDGYEVARRLRADRKTSTVPIIFLTEKRDRADRLQGLEIGADDYVTKPFDIQELRLRVRNAIQRANQETITNPVTGLPEGGIVDENIREYQKKEKWAFLVVSLRNMDAFRESYGFVAADDVVRAVSLMVNNTFRESGHRDNFLGHISPTDLLLIVEQETANNLVDRIHVRLAQALDFFYPIKDRENNDIKRLTVQISVMTSEQGRTLSVGEIKSELLQNKT